MADQSDEPARPRRVFISYAQDADSPDHDESVLRLYTFLRANGIDAQLDLLAALHRQDWAAWMAKEIRAADFVLMIASPAYRERAEDRSAPDVGRGVRWETRLIRDAFYRDQQALDRWVPVVLPGEDIDGLPDFLGPVTSTVFHVSDFTVAGADSLLRFLTGQPAIIEPPLGQVPVLAPRSIATNPPVSRRHRPEPTVHNEVSGNVTGTLIMFGNVGALSVPGSGTPTPGHVVGHGVPGWKSKFRSRYLALGRDVAVGEPDDRCGVLGAWCSSGVQRRVGPVRSAAGGGRD